MLRDSDLEYYALLSYMCGFFFRQTQPFNIG